MVIGVVMSDIRQEKIASLLKLHGLIVREVRSTIDLNDDLSIIILPVKGVNDEGLVKFKNSEISFKDYLDKANKDLIIYCGVKCSYFDNYSFTVINLLDDEDVLEYNSKLTAQGLLIDLLSNIDMAVDEIKMDLIGFGHSGKAIYRMFSKLCPNIRIISKQTMSDFEDFPVNIINYEDYKMLLDYPTIIINTAPSLIIDSKILKKLKHDTIILDIASSPGGVDYDVARELGITALLLPGLPSKYVSTSASRILSEKIIKDVEK